MKTFAVGALLAVSGAAWAQVPATWQEQGGSATGAGLGSIQSNQAPALVIDSGGVPIVAWASADLAPAICVRRWNGTTWTGVDGTEGSVMVAPLLPPTTAPVGAPAIVLDAAGSPVIAWHDHPTGNYEVFLRKWRSSPPGWVAMEGPSGSGMVSNTEGDSLYPSVGLDLQGSPVVAWEDKTVGSEQIYVARWDAGYRIWDSFDCDNQDEGRYYTSARGEGISPGFGGRFPSIAMDRQGRPVVAWGCSRNAGAKVNLRRWTGTTWIAQGDSTGNGTGISFVEAGTTVFLANQSFAPTCVLDSLDRPIVSWMEIVRIGTVNSYRVRVRRYAGNPAWTGMDGTENSVTVTTHPANDSHASMAIDAAGLPTVVWIDKVSGTWQVYVRRWSGTAWDEIPAGSASGSGIGTATSVFLTSGKGYPVVALDPSGNPVCAWTGIDPGTAAPTTLLRRLVPPPADPSTPDRLTLLELDGATEIPAGGHATQGVGFALRARMLDANPFDQVRLLVEVREVGVAFQDLPYPVAANGLSSPGGFATAVVRDTLALDKTYHWQVKAWDSTGRSSGWVTDGRTLLIPGIAPPQVRDGAQAWADGTPLSTGQAMLEDLVTFRATTTTGDPGRRAALEVEVRRVGIAFSGVATGSSTRVESGGSAAFTQTFETGSYHWQFRSLDNAGASSPWQSFGGNDEGAADFTVVALGSSGPASCGQSASGTLGAYALIALLAGGILRRGKSPALVLAGVIIAGGAAGAQVGGSWNELGGSASGSGAGLSDFAHFPVLVTDASGYPVVAWQAYDPDPLVRVRRWNGSAWKDIGDSLRIATGSMAKPVSANPSLALDPAGNPYIAWEDKTVGNKEIFVRHWSPDAGWTTMDGTSDSENVTNSTNDSVSPSIAVDRAGRPVVAWNEGRAQVYSKVYVRHWDDVRRVWATYDGQNAEESHFFESAQGDGVTWCNGASDNGFGHGAHVALDSNGWPVVAWHANLGQASCVLLRRWTMLDAIHGTWVQVGGSAQQIVVTQSDVYSQVSDIRPNHLAYLTDLYPTVVLDAADRPVVAWADGLDGTGGYLQRIRVRRYDGTAWVGMGGGHDLAVDVRSATTVATRPSLGLDPSGNPVVAWEEPLTLNTHVNWEVYAKRWNGSAWAELTPGSASVTGQGEGLTGTVSIGGVSATPDRSIGASIGVDLLGNPVVAWNEIATGPGPCTYVRRFVPPPLPPGAPHAITLLELDGATEIPAGDHVTLGIGFAVRARLADPNAEDQVRFRIEVREAADPFTGRVDAVSGPVSAGALASVTITQGLALDKTYHFRLQAVDSTDRISDWVDGGRFVSIPTIPPPAATSAGQSPFSSREDVVDGMRFRATIVTGDPRRQARLEVEARRVGQPFIGEATSATAMVAGGDIVQLTSSFVDGAYHWQYRAVDNAGAASAWTPYGGNEETVADFDMLWTGSTGVAQPCGQSAAGSTSGLAVLLAAAALAFRRT